MDRAKSTERSSTDSALTGSLRRLQLSAAAGDELQQRHAIPIPAPISIPPHAAPPALDASDIEISVSHSTLGRGMKPFDLKEGHANTHYRVFSEPLGAIEGPDVASGTAGSPLMMAGGNVSSDAVAIPQVLRRDRSRVEQIKPGAQSRARHASLGSNGSMPVSAASYGSIPLSPAVSFLAQFAEATSPSTFGNQENRLGTEGDQIGNYVLGRLLGRGAFSSVVEGWTAETGRSFDGESFGHVAIKVVPKESSPASVRVSSASNLASLGSAPDFGSFHSALGLGLARSRGTPPSQLSRDTPEPEPSQEALDREIAIWQRLKHPNITRMIEVLDTELATYIVCEFANGGSLFQLLQQHREGVPERVAWHLFRQIVEGVRYLHEDVSVCHGDLKLENVLLHSDRERQGRWEIAESLAMLRELVDLSTEDLERVQVKITDFGLSEYIGSPSPHRGESGFLAGTLPYVAPELFRRNPAGSPRSGATHNRASSTSRFEQSSANLLTKSRSQADLGMSSLIGSAAMLVSPGQDVWAAAVVLFALLTGTLPFQDDFAPRLQLKITRGQYDEGLLGQRGVTFGAREVIRRCLHVKEAERWTIRQLVESTWVSSGPSY